MAINKLLEPLQEIPYARNVQTVDLIRGVYLERLQCRVRGVVTVAGGAADGVLLTEGVARLIRSITVKWDAFDLVQRISGRDLYAITKRSVKRAPSGSAMTSPGVQAATELDLTFWVNFARPWLVNPFETVLPPLPVTSQFKIYVEWETDAANGSSDAGTGALISGGDRAVTWDEEPTLHILQVAALNGKTPWYIPVMSSFDSEQFSAANSRLLHQLVNDRAFDSVLFSVRQGATQAPAPLLNTLTFQSSGTRYLNAVDAAALHEDEQYNYPAVGDGGDDVGYYFHSFADGGWLSNVVDPGALVAPRFLFDLDAPSSAPGTVHMVFNELITIPELTLMQRVR